MHQHRRAFSDEPGSRRATKNLAEGRTIQSLAVALEPRARAHPNAPRFVRHAILDRLARAFRRIAPVMFGDEIFDRAFRHPRRLALRLSAQTEFAAAPF